MKEITGTVLTLRADVTTDPYVFAYSKHIGQTYGDSPYMVHVGEVFTIMYEALNCLYSDVDPFEDEEMHVYLIAALLHDVVEDCYDDRDEGIREVTALFGLSVGTAVDYVTDMDAPSREIRKSLFTARMTGITSEADERFVALAVKMADRLANMKTGLRTGNMRKLTMYLKEMPSFMYLCRGVKHHPLIGSLYARLVDVREMAKELTDFEY